MQRRSIFGPVFFLIYIDDVPQGLKSEVKLFFLSGFFFHRTAGEGGIHF